MRAKQLPFWETKTLGQMSRREWESLCDRCGKCCLIKLEDDITSQLAVTNVVCRYYDQENACCSEYRSRSKLVPDCITLSVDNIAACDFMPPTCAYRRLSEGRSLPEWHPLLTGSREAMVAAGVVVSGRVISEEGVHPDQLEAHIIDWYPGAETEEA